MGTTMSRMGRAGIVALILVLLFFVITDRVELAHANHSLDEASGQRSALIKQIDALQAQLTKSNQAVSILRTLIEQENELIRQLGGTPIPIPVGVFPPSPRDSNPNPHSSSSPSLTPRPRSSTVRPSPKPGNSPTPTPIICTNVIVTVCIGR